jgi:hypothetical protein
MYPILRWGEEDGKPGTYANSIQHPQGGLKQIAFRNNDIFETTTEKPPADAARFLHYRTDTLPGSSGSPMLDDKWKVIALHHSGVPSLDASGNPLDKDGKRAKKDSDIHWIANEGIRGTKLLEICQKELKLRVNESKQENPIRLARRAAITRKDRSPALTQSAAAASGGGFGLGGQSGYFAAGSGGGNTITVPVTLSVTASWNPSGLSGSNPFAFAPGAYANAATNTDAETDGKTTTTAATTSTTKGDVGVVPEEGFVKRGTAEFANCKGFKADFLGPPARCRRSPAARASVSIITTTPWS